MRRQHRGAGDRVTESCGLLTFLIARIAYRGFRGREGLGLGDVKLAAAAGAWLSLPMLPIAIEIAAITALMLSLFVRGSGCVSSAPRGGLPSERFSPRQYGSVGCWARCSP
jgi:hypothetical protein